MRSSVINALHQRCMSNRAVATMLSCVRPHASRLRRTLRSEIFAGDAPLKCPPSFRSVHVSLDRRTFVSRAARMAAAAAVAPSHALDAPASAVVFTDDPLGVRGDFPILQNGRTFLNSAYITPSPRAVTAAGVAFLEAK